MSSSIVHSMAPTDIRENWWDKSNKLDSFANSSVNDIFGANETNGSSFSASLENILARADEISANNGLNVSRAAPTTVTGEAVTFEELINSENAQIREFAVLDQQPLSPDWAVLKNANPVTPSNFKALNGLSDGLMLSQRFANALYAVQLDQ